MSQPMRSVPMGPRARLVEIADHDPADVADAIRLLGVPGVVEVVPGAATVLVEVADDDAMGRLLNALAALDVGATTPTDPAAGDAVRIPVVYDGPDLDEVAERCGVDAAEVVRRHTAVVHRVGFCGFAPGFAYLVGLDPSLHLPRRSTPRTRVEPGSVAIASRFSAVYPGASPGGWHLIGRTTLAVWDLRRDPPALLAPGTRVRFEAAEGGPC